MAWQRAEDKSLPGPMITYLFFNHLNFSTSYCRIHDAHHKIFWNGWATSMFHSFELKRNFTGILQLASDILPVALNMILWNCVRNRKQSGFKHKEKQLHFPFTLGQKHSMINITMSLLNYDQHDALKHEGHAQYLHNFNAIYLSLSKWKCSF